MSNFALSRVISCKMLLFSVGHYFLFLPLFPIFRGSSFAERPKKKEMQEGVESCSDNLFSHPLTTTCIFLLRKQDRKCPAINLELNKNT